MESIVVQDRKEQIKNRRPGPVPATTHESVGHIFAVFLGGGEGGKARILEGN